MIIPPWDQLTPLQQMVSEVLVARYRLGESEWSIKKSSAMMKALNNMRDLGWISYRSHNASPNYLYVKLTEYARKGQDLPATPPHIVKEIDLGAMQELPSGIFDNARVKEVRIIYT